MQAAENQARRGRRGGRRGRAGCVLLQGQGQYLCKEGCSQEDCVQEGIQKAYIWEACKFYQNRTNLRKIHYFLTSSPLPFNHYFSAVSFNNPFTFYNPFMPIAVRICSKIISWSVVVGANLSK